eukprot:CAMPEP_0119572880 /NCGR_PEP_ID=MMETSP1352-20130426/44845_1 /TAXON_ID=265584 /ORGANISM="Stauroneis constricta, Strain CCMP1120" /LENGTH=722 /DNA_ID=CAMNT_0007622567 /DNA_START=279 /DNA_END=2447 /DNA_ORIENTATION=+
MKFSTAAISSALLLASFMPTTNAFMTPSRLNNHHRLQSTVDETTTETLPNISKLQFREVKRELERYELDTHGTLTQMKDRLRNQISTTTTNHNRMDELTVTTDDIDEAFEKQGISFTDTSDPDFEFKNLIRETLEKADMGHWKAATRKLKKLSRRFGAQSADPRDDIPQAVYDATLAACMADRLHGARAAEPARKILDQMVEQGFEISQRAVNFCIKNSLGDGPNGTHQGFGGIDTALAIMATAEASATPPAIEIMTYEKLIGMMAKSGAVEDALTTLRALVVDKSETPTLQVFADVAMGAVSNGAKNAEHVLTVLAYAKAAGYNLDNIASTVDGRDLLASAVVAAERMNNIPLGLRLLTAASKAEGCAPDRGDILVASASSAAQRASTIIHRQAINKAVQDESWKLAVKLLEIMLGRSLRPSPSVWRNVVTCCAKAEKSRKAAALLFDWVQLSKIGRAEQPPLRVFNTVMNACEICGEEDLTVDVLDCMKATHNTEGNLITFNIALKRLAKQGNTRACEGIIVGMLQSGIEPSVVSYTTAIASCVSEPKNSEMASEWVNRMRSRRVQPNIITYNTALAACLDGTLEGSQRGSVLASQMLADVQMQLAAAADETDNTNGGGKEDEYTRLSPNVYTKTLARELMKQLKANWEEGKIDRAVAKTTVRTPLRALLEFEKTEAALKAQEIESRTRGKEEDEVTKTVEVEEDLEFSVAVKTHRAAAV